MCHATCPLGLNELKVGVGVESGVESLKLGCESMDAFADLITLAAHCDLQPALSSLRAALTSTLPFLIGAVPPPAVEDTRWNSSSVLIRSNVRARACPLWAFAFVICLFPWLCGAVLGAVSEDALSTNGIFHNSSALSTQGSITRGMFCGAPIAARFDASSLSPFSTLHPASTATMASSGTAARESVNVCMDDFRGTMHGGKRAHLCLSKGHGLYGHEVTHRCPLFRACPVLALRSSPLPPCVFLIAAQPPPPEKVHCLWEPLPATLVSTDCPSCSTLSCCTFALSCRRPLPDSPHPDAMLLCCDSALL